MTVDDSSWTLKFDHFSELQNVISDNPSTHSPTSLSRIAYENRYVTHLFPIFNSYLFNRINIVSIYANEWSRSLSLIKRRTEYLTKALLAQFSKIIMFLQFLLENVSWRFENDFIYEIEYSWSVNIDKAGPILAVYCVQLSHTITWHFSKYFQILYIFVQILKYFALFLKHRTHALPF